MPVKESHEFFIQLHLTERCNLRCLHCYQTGGGSDELTIAEIRSLVSEVSEMLGEWSNAYGITFLPSFNVTGGEPFLRPDLCEIIEEISGHGFDVYILTNGTLIDERKANDVSSLGVSGVQVSIEGPEEIHDRIRGWGSFSASLAGVERLTDAGLTVTLNTTLSSLNADHIVEMMSLASSLGVHNLGFARLVPSGRGQTLVDRVLPAARVRAVCDRLFSAKGIGFQVVSGDPMANQLHVPEKTIADSDVPSGGCAAAVSGLTILPDGTITPCRRLPIPIGNVRKDSLREVWVLSPVLERLRSREEYGGRCGRCRRWSICRGCRAVAYAWAIAHGRDDFLAEDPQCFIGDGH